MFSLAAAGVKNTVSVFRWLSGTGEEKMDPDKSVVFAYDGVPAHIDLAIPAPYVHSLYFQYSESVRENDLHWALGTGTVDSSS